MLLYAGAITRRDVVAAEAVAAAGGAVVLTMVQSGGAPGWVLKLSPYTYLAPVPSSAPDWAGALGMLVLAAAFSLLGVRGYQRRDLRG